MSVGLLITVFIGIGLTSLLLAVAALAGWL